MIYAAKNRVIIGLGKACRLFIAKPLPKPMMKYSWMENSKWYFNQNTPNFHMKKCIWQFHQQNGRHFSCHQWITRSSYTGIIPHSEMPMYWTKRYAWASYQIHKIAGAHAPGMPGSFSPSPQVSDPGMHHGTCVTHVQWGMPRSLTNGFLWNRRRGKTFSAFPAHAQPAILHIW